MYVRMVQAVLGPDTDWEVQHMGDLLAAECRRHPGFIDVQMLANYDTGEYASITWWQTKEDALSSYKILQSRILELVGDRFQWPPVAEIFEVYHPKTVYLDK